MSRLGGSLAEFGFVPSSTKFTPEREDALFGWKKKPREERAEVDGYKPTAGMRAEAQRGLDWRSEFNRGGTAVGIARARDIVNGKSLPLATVKRMASFFARHAVDRDAPGFKPSGDGYPSNGRIAWALWGGDAGWAFAKRIVARAAGAKKKRK
jgi:hypothetical protein